MELRHIISTVKYNKFIAFIIVVQVALSLSVVSNSFFLALKTYEQWSLPSGLDNENIVTVTAKGYKEGMDYQAAHNDDMKLLGQMDGVLAVMPMDRTPIAAGWPNTVYLGTGEQKQSFQSHIFDFDHQASQIMSLKIIEGRDIDANDVIYGDQQGDAPVVLVSEDMAKTLFGDQSAIGKTLWLRADSSPAQIVGVYSNFLSSQFLAGKGMPYQGIIRPKVQWDVNNTQNYMLKVEPGMADEVKNKLSEYFSTAPGRFSYSPETLNDLKARAFAKRLGTMNMYLAISVLLMVITFCGLLGLISFLTSTRTKQIGIRRALGAKKKSIIYEFIVENSLVTVIGLVVGLVFTLLISSLFYEFNGMESQHLIYVVPVAFAILLLNTLAVYVPVRNKVNSTPAQAMR